jgi:hypothetical protein
VDVLNGVATFNNSSSSQAVFKGWSTYGGVANHAGEITIGGNASSQGAGRLAYGSDFQLRLENTNPARVNIGMSTATGSAAIYPLMVSPNNGGQVLFSNDISTPALFSGYSPYSGVQNSGMLYIGPTTGISSQGARLIQSGNLGKLSIEEVNDGTIEFNINSGNNGVNGTTPLTLTGKLASFASSTTVNSLARFQNPLSTSAVFSGWSNYSGFHAGNGSIQLGSFTGLPAAFLDWDYANSGNFLIGVTGQQRIKFGINTQSATPNYPLVFNADGTVTIGSMTVTGTSTFNSNAAFLSTITVSGQVNNGYEIVTNDCGLAATSCTASCSANKSATGGSCHPSVGTPSAETLMTWGFKCETAVATSLVATVACMRVGP